MKLSTLATISPFILLAVASPLAVDANDPPLAKRDGVIVYTANGVDSGVGV